MMQVIKSRRTKAAAQVTDNVHPPLPAQFTPTYLLRSDGGWGGALKGGLAGWETVVSEETFRFLLVWIRVNLFPSFF